MWILKINRTQLLDVFKDCTGSWIDNYNPKHVDVIPYEQCNSNEFFLVWKHQPCKHYQIPVAIIIDKEFQKDFVAWSLTYLSHVSPISSYCRIIDLETFNNLLDCHPENIKLPESVYVSIIAAELLAYMDGSLEKINVAHGNVVTSTYSFARTRGKFYQYRNVFPEDLTTAWSRARALNNKNMSRNFLDTLNEIWLCLDVFDNDIKSNTLFSAADPQIVAALEEYSTLGMISSVKMKKFAKTFLNMQDLEDITNGTLENRVSLSEKILSQFANRKSSDKNISFISAYIVSQISPGTLDHFEILKPYSEAFSSAYLWLGVLAGLHPKSRICQGLGNLSNRILRDLHKQDNILEQPQSDISYLELDTLANHLKDLRAIPSRYNGYIEVEIAPFIVTTIKSARYDESLQSELFPRQSLSQKEMQFTLYELEDSLRRVEQVKRKLFSFIGTSSKDRR